MERLQQVCIFKCHCHSLSLVYSFLSALNRIVIISGSILVVLLQKKNFRCKEKKSFASLNRSVGAVHKYQKSTGAPAHCPYFSLIGYNVWVKEGPWTKRSLLNVIFFCEYGLFSFRNETKCFKSQSNIEKALSVIVFLCIRCIFIFIPTANCIIVSYYRNHIIWPNYAALVTNKSSPRGAMAPHFFHSLITLWSGVSGFNTLILPCN